jgi:hypothetical protein
MLVGLFVSMVFLNDLIKEWRKNCVGIVRSSVDTDSGVYIFATGENGALEVKTEFILFAAKLFKDFLSQVLAQQRLAAWWEAWHSCEVSARLEMTAALDTTRWHLHSRSLLLLLVSTFLWLLINFKRLSLRWVMCHSALSARTRLLELALGPLVVSISVTALLERYGSSQVLRAVFSLALILNDHHAFISNELTIWPVAALELGEDAHAFVAHLESASPWNLLEERGVRVLVGHQVVVDIEWKILLRDLILHDHGVGDSINDASSNFLEKLKVLGLVMAGVPAVLFAVLTKLDNKNDIVVAAVVVSIIHLL